jgi:hypothetical protein
MNQIVKMFSRHEFETLAKEHHVGQRFRSFNRWSQFIAMMAGQLSSRKSLRDLIENLNAQRHKLYHLGMRETSRATLARCNEKQPARLFEVLFYNLLARCRQCAPPHKFSFKAKLYLLDATIVDLCLSVFPWATFRKTKGAIKLHVGLDADGYLPEFLSVTSGKAHELRWAKALQLPKGSFVVFDRAFTDYGWYKHLIEAGIFFVTRLKANALLLKHKQRPGRKSAGIISDRPVSLINFPYKLRLVTHRDPETGKKYQFLTNADHLSAKIVADLYKERWQIELFFKWIKQNLKIKTFLGTSKNAVLTQIWIALCVYLILAYIKFSAKLKLTLQQILRLLQLNLFERRELLALFKPPDLQRAICKQLPLWAMG